MPYRKDFFEKGGPFHILSRAIDDRKIFKSESDCYRFIFQLHAANIGKPAPNLWRKDVVKSAQSLLRGIGVSSEFIVKEHDPLVHILDFSLVVNHYHIYLVSNIEKGISIYMHKLNTGFAKYFNLKHQRSGPLFNSRYKSIPVKTERQSFVLSRYINTINPLDVYQPGWRENGLKDKNKAFEFLKTYQFSSFPDKIGKRNSKILASKEILETFLPGQGVDYAQFIDDFLEDRLADFEKFFLE